MSFTVFSAIHYLAKIPACPLEVSGKGALWMIPMVSIDDVVNLNVAIFADGTFDSSAFMNSSVKQ